MLSNLPNAHAHISLSEPNQGPCFMCGCDPQEWQQLAILARKHANITPFFGVHPWYIQGMEGEHCMNLLQSYLQQFPYAGIGEIGLDKCKRFIACAEQQKQIFVRQLQMAKYLHRPVTIHCCRAWGTLAALIDADITVIVHGWSGACELTVFKHIKRCFFSVGPNSLSHINVVQHIAPDRLLLESDEQEHLLPVLYHAVATQLHVSQQTVIDLVNGNMATVRR